MKTICEVEFGTTTFLAFQNAMVNASAVQSVRVDPVQQRAIVWLRDEENACEGEAYDLIDTENLPEYLRGMYRSNGPRESAK